jgi:hypothetical protein
MAVLPELTRVAEVYKSLAQLYIVNGKSGWKKPPYKTGNLYNRVGSYNNASNMVLVRNPRSTTKLKIPNQSFSVALQYAPPGAEYGKFVEEGTSKMAARPFAESAANDPLLKRAIDNAIKGIVDDTILPVIKVGMDRAFKRMQTKK